MEFCSLNFKWGWEDSFFKRNFVTIEFVKSRIHCISIGFTDYRSNQLYRWIICSLFSFLLQSCESWRISRVEHHRHGQRPSDGLRGVIESSNHSRPTHRHLLSRDWQAETGCDLALQRRVGRRRRRRIHVASRVQLLRQRAFAAYSQRSDQLLRQLHLHRHQYRGWICTL